MNWNYATTIGIGAEVLELIYGYEENFEASIIDIEGLFKLGFNTP